jgi:hypothetical protein
LQKLRELDVGRVLFVSVDNVPDVMEIAQLRENALTGLRDGTLYLPDRASIAMECSRREQASRGKYSRKPKWRKWRKGGSG